MARSWPGRAGRRRLHGHHQRGDYVPDDHRFGASEAFGEAQTVMNASSSDQGLTGANLNAFLYWWGSTTPSENGDNEA